MTEYEKIKKIIEENKDKSLEEIAKIIDKSKSWVSRFNKFANASLEEKERLKEEKNFKNIYKMWEEYLKENKEEREKLEEEKRKFEEQIDKKIETIENCKEYIFELEHCKKLVKSLEEDNIYKAKSINTAINEMNKLRKQLEIEKIKGQMVIAITGIGLGVIFFGFGEKAAGITAAILPTFTCLGLEIKSFIKNKKEKNEKEEECSLQQ